MARVPGIVKQLKKERDKVERQLSALNAGLAAFVGTYYGAKPAKPTRKRRKMSAKARAKIAAAQKARWKVWKAKQKKAA
jgi:hypothetical protein